MFLRMVPKLLIQAAVRVQLQADISKEGIPMDGDAFY